MTFFRQEDVLMLRFTRVFAAGILGGLGLTLAAAPVRAFGPAGQQAVLAKAIDTLPKPLKQFYKDHRLEMPSLSPEARYGERTPDRRFELDRLMPFPFLDLPHGEAGLKARFGEDVGERIGRLPWLVEDGYARLVEAFRAAERARILEESDLLAGLIIDLHNPLALTENSDGQKTLQHGLKARFSVRSLEAMQTRIKLSPDAANYLDKPTEFVFSMINGTYVWLDNVLYEEELARRGKPGYTETYYEDFERRVWPIQRLLLNKAAEAVGSYWYTAWVAAGKPDLKAGGGGAAALPSRYPGRDAVGGRPEADRLSLTP